MNVRVLVVASLVLLAADTASTQDWPLRGPGASIGALVIDSTPTDVSAPQTVIADVPRDTPAARAGLRKGDVITDFDGLRVENARQFRRIVADTPPGRMVKMTVTRDGVRRQLSIIPIPSRAQ
jgi:S1-C subfamily serine protease